ncbi:Fic family protein [Methylobacterium tardum]|nr:Fic family protein [Methylobacterium tardum]URD38204.1 Fic family protein [Methylobacterium tardum]
MPIEPKDYLADRIAALKHRMVKLRPLDGVALEKLNASFDVELTYTSNAIEGNTLTHRETGLVIEKGITIGGKTVVEHMEALDHYEAVQTMRQIAAESRPVTERDVLDLHRIVTYRSNPKISGIYSDSLRRIVGSDVILPGPHKIPGLMERFGQSLERAQGWQSAFEAHYALVTIHPFSDGNGRTARLLMNLLLLKDGLPPVPIRPEVRAEYLKVLEDRQLAEPLGHDVRDPRTRSAYRNFMGTCLVQATERYLSIVEPEREDRKPAPSPRGRDGGGIGD